jgi:hypothetical protein
MFGNVPESVGFHFVLLCVVIGNRITFLRLFGLSLSLLGSNLSLFLIVGIFFLGTTSFLGWIWSSRCLITVSIDNFASYELEFAGIINDFLEFNLA